MPDGLDGVVVADTVLSHSDADAGRLWICGRSLEEAVHELGFEGIVALLWKGLAGSVLSRADMLNRLGTGRRRAFDRVASWLGQTAAIPVAEALRICLASIPDTCTAAEITGAVSVGVAAILRQKRGLPPVAPDPALSTPADLLRMMEGAPATPSSVRALDAYFTVAAENGLSSSTFAARVIASTRASFSSAVLGAYCAFTGPLHGAAPGLVLGMLDEVQASGEVDRWLERKLSAGERIPGFGNRAFPNGDPRAKALAEALRALAIDEARSKFAADFEQRAMAALARHRPGRRLQPNFELNAALLLDACGIPREGFTAVFAAARVVGWLAHAIEQQQTGRMIRPRSRYVGPPVE